MYFWLRFGFANTIIQKIVSCVGNLTLNAYQLNSSYQMWVRFIFAYQKSLKHTFQTGFGLQNQLLNLFCRVVISQRLFVVKKLVWNVRDKPFCYTKPISIIMYLFEFVIYHLQLNLKFFLFWGHFRHSKNPLFF